MVKPAIYVIERFPQHELAIERLVRTCETFRSMCEDYAVGIEALRRWEGSPDPRRSERIAELSDALAELEQEILEALEQDTRPRSG
jgi:ribosomal protein S19E (S16A)